MTGVEHGIAAIHSLAHPPQALSSPGFVVTIIDRRHAYLKSRP
jgi:hypothetical protein